MEGLAPWRKGLLFSNRRIKTEQEKEKGALMLSVVKKHCIKEFFELFISNLIWITPLTILTLGEYYVQSLSKSYNKSKKLC